jgi:hypothetical protein
MPRVARLLALAIRLEQLVQARVIANYAVLAEIGHVSRARVTQILNLLRLAATFKRPCCFCLGRNGAATPFTWVSSRG